MTPGSRWVYRERGENGRTQRVTVTVTHRTRKVAGVRARIVHDVVTQGGRLVEDTYDWYAQDRAGNIWYLGEDTTEHQDGGSTREGSWEAVVDGAQAGVIMPAQPARRTALPPGVLRRARRGPRRRSRASTGAPGALRALLGRPRHARLQPADKGPAEHKYYAKGIGPVLGVSGGGSREELVSFRKG